MKQFFLGMIIGLAGLAAFVFVYVRLGYAPVATAAPPFPFEKRLAGMALHARIAKEAPTESPILPSEENVMAGAKLYRQHCAECHGLIGQLPTPTALGMFPKPPQLFKGKGVTDDPAGETYWKAANGIRLTGMPGYARMLTDMQLWQISQLLATADKLPASVRDVISQPLPAK